VHQIACEYNLHVLHVAEIASYSVEMASDKRQMLPESDIFGASNNEGPTPILLEDVACEQF